MVLVENELKEPLLQASKDADAVLKNNSPTKKACDDLQRDEDEVSTSVDDLCPPIDNVLGQGFKIREELWEMMSLGIPLAISFFCRMGMASTDSSFVGHIHDGEESAETYLAACVLSNMCVGIFTVPPLAFNQVLNGLVSQAMGSGNPKMAGIWLQQSVFWLTLTMLPCLIGCFYIEPMLLLLGFPPNISRVAGEYGKFNVIWPIPNGVYQCMRFYFQAQGLPRPAMYNNIIFLFVNALLNYIFVLGGPFRYFEIFGNWKGFGFIGAAISISISRTLQSVAYFLYMFVNKGLHKPTWPGLALKHHTTVRTKEFMKQSIPNIGTLLFQQCASQATTLLLGQLGESAIATSSALSTVSIPWSGTISATSCTISSIRVGYHLGRGNGDFAQKSSWLVILFISFVTALMSIFFMSFRESILNIATDDDDIISRGSDLIPAMLIGTYLNLLVSNITSGVFSGMGRPIIATILSFGFELPLSIGGVALYILEFHGNLLGVYWFQAISGGLEALVVIIILSVSNWQKYANEVILRQESREISRSTEVNDEENSSINN